MIVLLALVLGGATWFSQKSLPGGTLYGLKRASESVRLAFASNSTDAAGDRLQFAATRVDEARKLLHQPTASALGRGPQADGGVSAATARLVDQTLTSADDDVLSASRALTTNALKRKSGAPLTTMITWAPGQAARLRELAAAAPTSSLRARAIDSQNLVTAALTRADAVRPLAACACMGTARSDRSVRCRAPRVVPPRSRPARHRSAPRRPRCPARRLRVARQARAPGRRAARRRRRNRRARAAGAPPRRPGFRCRPCRHRTRPSCTCRRRRHRCRSRSLLAASRSPSDRSACTWGRAPRRTTSAHRTRAHSTRR